MQWITCGQKQHSNSNVTLFLDDSYVTLRGMCSCSMILISETKIKSREWIVVKILCCAYVKLLLEIDFHKEIVYMLLQ